ncbi:hypothetical protein [Criblamydia sequanensis]|uniref:Membrane protein n=1 Tax=Candidatus Criblamydia sequanensis CRIB-18 TaxID=1437425 RepID=A0A090CZ90_9BACT|nr:hypothetical protein [Criblamydia sequanensis]CDR34262.1 putative membrane protein [Criblamydia sequanensis CRIB-18]
MQRKYVTLALVALFSIATAIYAYDALKKSWFYFQLDGQTKIEAPNFFVKEISDEKYAVEGRYGYKIKDKTYQGISRVGGRFYRNEFAASSAIKKIQTPLPVYFSKNSPEISSLEKNFPYKEVVYSLILLGGFLYFVALGYSFSKKA